MVANVKTMGQVWTEGYNQVASVRIQEPHNKSSNVTHNWFIRKTGDKFQANEKHGFLFRLLADHLAHPEFSPASCWVSQETMAREMNRSLKVVRETLDDLEAMGLVYRVQRKQTSNETWLFFNPYEPGTVPDLTPLPFDPVEPLPRPASGARAEKTLIPNTDVAINALKNIFPEHPNFYDEDQLKWLKSNISKALRRAGGWGPFKVLLAMALHENNPEAKKNYAHIARATSLGNYLHTCVGNWKKQWPEQYAAELARAAHAAQETLLGE
jgi:hypothetical protein